LAVMIAAAGRSSFQHGGSSGRLEALKDSASVWQIFASRWKKPGDGEVSALMYRNG
jgi:hypothetical protein